jgi:anaerobic selenocysteine-containing dehydrogenase
VARIARERAGEKFEWAWQANPGEVWEEDEFWIALSWAIDPDGTLGVRQYFESPYRPGERITVEEVYRWIFENSVPGLPEAAAAAGLTPLEYMRRYGAFAVKDDTVAAHTAPVDVSGATLDSAAGVWVRHGARIAVDAGGTPQTGFPTPSRKLEIYSPTMTAWGYGDAALPGYIRSHVHPSSLDPARGELVLVPTFRLPTLIHTRTGNAKWLYELSNTNPVWIHPHDAGPLGLQTGDLLRITTRIGYFVNKAWVTEGIRPGVVACSHHLGRWRLPGQPGTDRWAAPPVAMERTPDGRWRVRRAGDITKFTSGDPDSERIWWTEGGVHQNLTFPVQPDPISGMHCWHQKVTVTRAAAGDRYGDIEVDPRQAEAVFREWLALAPRRDGPGGLRRPEWFSRPYRPSARAYRRG